MGHPGLWGFGLASVGLIAAGVWLKMPDWQTATVAVSPVPLTVPLAPATSGTDIPDSSGPAVLPRSTVEPALAPAPVATGAAPPPQDAPASGKAPAVPPLPPASGMPTVPSQPVPPSQTGTAAEPAAPTAGFQPVLFSGDPVWQTVAARGFGDDQARLLRSSAEAVVQGPAWFGAVAASLHAPTEPFVVQGYASLAGAENAATTLCARRHADCHILARLVPQDFDDRRTGTLSAAQAGVWRLFLEPGVEAVGSPAQSGATTPLHRAFAFSMDGGAGIGEGLSPALAGQAALSRCRALQRQLNHPHGTPSVRCQIAQRDPD